jgi:diguanylate cyclase (GGDEF)-like protein
MPDWREGRALFEQDVREGRSGSLILCNVDHMRRVNDTVGHLKGDQVLCVVAMELESAADPRGGIVYRQWGSFAVRLPGCEVDDAVHVAEEARERIPTAATEVVDRDPRITVRSGVVAWTEADVDASRTAHARSLMPLLYDAELAFALRLLGDLEGTLWHLPLPRDATVVLRDNGERTVVTRK